VQLLDLGRPEPLRRRARAGAGRFENPVGRIGADPAEPLIRNCRSVRASVSPSISPSASSETLVACDAPP